MANAASWLPGARQVPLVYPAENFGIPRWSPDGRQLLISNVFRFDTAGNLLPFRPATVGVDGSNFNLLQPPGAPFDMACFGGWYPDATRLLCGYGEGPPGVFSIRPSDGGDPARLTTYPFGKSCNTCDEATDVSPDGTRFVFLRFKRENAANFREEQVALFVENINGTGLRQITPYGLAAPHEAASARWSPDGKEIISETTQGRLLVVHPDGSGLRMIPLQTGPTSDFAFQPDGSPQPGGRRTHRTVVAAQARGSRRPGKGPSSQPGPAGERLAIGIERLCEGRDCDDRIFSLAAGPDF